VRRPTKLLIPITFWALLVPAPARADAPSCARGEVECGREAFVRGTASFDRGEYAEASQWFGAAAGADPHPTVLYNWAVSEARLGKVLAARARLDLLLADARTDAALRVRAERERESVEARVAHVRFELFDPATSRVELDGQVVDVARGELPLDPGAHRVRVSSAGAWVFDRTLELAPGERLSVRLGHRASAIDIVVVPTTSTAPPVPAPPREAREPRQAGVSPTWFYVGAGATAALAGLGVWSALDVQRAHDDYEADLPELTQAEADERVESGHRRELRTNLLFAATALSAVGTATLGVLFVDWSGRGSGSARLELRPGALSLRARF